MHDWDIIASREPFFGVVSAEEFRAHRFDEQARRRFYESGERDVAQVLDWFDADLGVRPAQGTALDIGCGVGRLSYAMAKVMPRVVGYDVSKVMIDIAAEAAPANLSLTTSLPAGSFSWINSYIVFQHIPPPEGLALLERCLALAAPGALISLQITGWRDLPPPSQSLRGRFHLWRTLRRHRREGGSADQLIQMHDYNFSDVMRRLVQRNCSRIVVRHTGHGPHHGAWFLARRD